MDVLKINDGDDDHHRIIDYHTKNIPSLTFNGYESQDELHSV